MTVVLVLVLMLGGMTALVAYLLRTRLVGDSRAETPGGEVSLVRAAELMLDVSPAPTGHELRLAGQPLMNLDTASEIEVASRQRMTGPYARFLGSLLQQPSILEFIRGERYVLARVPKAIRQGGQWMRTADGTLKAVATAPGSNRFTAIAEIVKGGVATGTAAALGPALLASVSTAHAQHRIEAAIEDLGRTLDRISDRVRDADLGVVLGAKELLGEVSEWGPPHLWPEQLRWELAVRRSALDPVWYALHRELERTVSRMVKNGTKFIGLPTDEHDELRRKAYELTLALLVRAQLDYSTAMVLLDSTSAPYGLERLERIEDLFKRDLLSLQAMFETAINGSRPLPLTNARRRARRTELHVRGVIEYLVARISELEPIEDEALVLSIDADGDLIIEALPAGEVTLESQAAEADLGERETGRTRNRPAMVRRPSVGRVFLGPPSRWRPLLSGVAVRRVDMPPAESAPTWRSRD